MARRVPVPSAHALVYPSRPQQSAHLLARLAHIKRRQHQSLRLASHPALARLFPHAPSGRVRDTLLKRKIKQERRFINDHFNFLTRDPVHHRERRLPFGELRKESTPIAKRTAFYNLRPGDKVRLTEGHPALLWHTEASLREAHEAKEARRRAEHVRNNGQKDDFVARPFDGARWLKEGGERKPRLWTIRSIDKVKGKVRLWGLEYEEFVDLSGPSDSTQTRKVPILVPYDHLQLFIPPEVVRGYVDKLRAAGADVNKEVPFYVFAKRLKTVNVSAPDARTKRYRWEAHDRRRAVESSLSLAGLRRSGHLSQRARVARAQQELDDADKGLATHTATVDKAVAVRRVGSTEFERTGATETARVRQTVNAATGVVVRSAPVPREHEYVPGAFTWDRVVLETVPPLAVGHAVRELERVDEDEHEVRYAEVDRRIQMRLPVYRGRQAVELRDPGLLDTPPAEVVKATWVPPTVEELRMSLEATRGGKPHRTPDLYFESRAQRLQVRAENAFLDDAASSTPIEMFAAKELGNPYARDRRAKRIRARRALDADALADFVADTVGAHLVREARVQRGEEPRVGRRMTVDEVILTARRRWAEKMAEERQVRLADAAARFREKWGPSRTEQKQERRARRKTILLNQLRKTTLIPGKNQVIPVGLERKPGESWHVPPVGIAPREAA